MVRTLKFGANQLKRCSDQEEKPSSVGLAKWIVVAPNVGLRPPAGMLELEESHIDRQQPVSGNATFSQRYEILQEIGAGGMGLVFLGRDKVLNREVAIKRLKLSTATEQMWLRFQQEAMACAALRHPNIVSIFDYGSDEQYVPYIVLDYLGGLTLRQYLDQKTVLSCTETFNLVLPLLDGLEHAHNNGVVHRDLKPANIFLQRVEGSDRFIVKIMDFGIAKVISDRESGFETKTGEVFGSPFYISPEQLTGDEVDRRCDLYALGCVIFEMLCGKPPFMGSNTLATFMMHKSDAVPSLRQRLQGQPFCDAVDPIVTRLLQKDVSRRYQSVAQVRADVLAAQEGWSNDPQRLRKRQAQTPVATSVDNIYASKLNEKSDRSGTFSIEGKNKLAVAAAALAAALVGTVLFVALQERSTSPAPPVAPRPSKRVDLGLDHKLERLPLSQLSRFSVRNSNGVILNLSEFSNFNEISKAIAGRLDTYCIMLQDMPAGKGSFANLRHLPRLRELKLIDLFDLDAAMMKDITAIQTLKRFEISSTVKPLPEDIFKSLKLSKVSSMLIGADLTEPQLRDLASHTSLEVLNFNRCRLDESKLSLLKPLKALTYLRMEGCGLEGHELAVLSELPKLKELYLNSNPLSARSFRKLSPLLRIKEVEADTSFVGDAEMLEFCRVFANVEKIDIARTRVTDVGVRALSKLRNLQHVDLTEDKISDDSLRYLAQAPNLRKVCVPGSAVTADGIIELMRRHPGVTIEYTPDEDGVETVRLKQVAEETKSELVADKGGLNSIDALGAVTDGLGR